MIGVIDSAKVGRRLARSFFSFICNSSFYPHSRQFHILSRQELKIRTYYIKKGDGPQLKVYTFLIF